MGNLCVFRKTLVVKLLRAWHNPHALSRGYPVTFTDDAKTGIVFAPVMIDTDIELC